MFSKSEFSYGFKIKDHCKALIKGFFNRLGSIRLRIFFAVMVLSLLPMYIVKEVLSFYYVEALIDTQVANMQTRSAVLADEFSRFSSLGEAQKAGMYTQMVQYSSTNFVRVRIIDNNFVIASDSYSIETGKNILNSRVISALTSRKSRADYDSSTGTIEAVVPVYNIEGYVMGVLVMDMDVSEVKAFAVRVDDKMMTVLFTIVVVVTALSMVLTRSIGSNFRKAFRTVEEVANGHTDKRIKVRGSTEMRQFAKDFNTIMDKASVLDENRQEFVSNVSHELKTPITSIKVLADSLNMQEDVPIELYREFMQDITTEIDRESKIIEDLLSLVKMDKAASALNITSVNLNELLEIVLKRLKPIAQKKNVEMLFESFRPVVAEIDEVKFTQVVSNLVENAIKYNRLDGWVHVSLNADYQYFYVRVEDSGIGIPEESQDMVFERFYRVDKARSRETGGTGLGLAIVKKIILMHHGTVKLHSEEGTGTTFTVRIPLNYVE